MAKPSGKKWGFKVHPELVAGTLSSKLYRDKGASLAEPVRNGWCACMSDPSNWDATSAHVEVWLVYNHPLAPKKYALVIMDRGSGFTEPRIKEFCDIGGTPSAGKHGGASQNGIGRFALFALNQRVAEKDYDEGFTIMTRTSSSGPVTMVEITPNKISRNEVEDHTIGPDASELWRYSNIVGSFTVIVVPNAVFSDESEIREVLKWRIPRIPGVKVYVNGKLLEPPPLGNIKIAAGAIVAHLSRPKVANVDEGIWLTDAKSGLRCAKASDLGSSIPYPLGRHDLTGDIMIPGLLKHQNTSRSCLNDRFLRSKAWSDLFDILNLKIVPEAQKMLGEDDVISDADPTHRILYEFADLFRAAWGPSTVQGGDILTGQNPARPPRPPKRPVTPGVNPPPGNHQPPGGVPGHGGNGGNGGSGRPRAIGIKIGPDEFYFQTYPSGDKLVFAEVGMKGKAICINPNYSLSPTNKFAEREHKLGRVFDAVARWRFPNETAAAHRLSTQFREELEVAIAKKK